MKEEGVKFFWKSEKDSYSRCKKNHKMQGQNCC